MQFSAQFSIMFTSILAALVVGVAAGPVTDQSTVDGRDSKVARATGSDGDARVATYVLTFDEMKHWLATTDAKLTFVGTPINQLSTESADETTVTYCNTRADDVCGGICTVYTGGAACLNAPGTNCLAATQNVAFCSNFCGGTCNQYDSCGEKLDDGFCYTPDTNAILVGA